MEPETDGRGSKTAGTVKVLGGVVSQTVRDELVFSLFFFFKQKTAYEVYQCDWSSDFRSGLSLTQQFRLTNNIAYFFWS